MSVARIAHSLRHFTWCPNSPAVDIPAVTILRLNDVTIPNRYPIPHMHDFSASLHLRALRTPLCFYRLCVKKVGKVGADIHGTPRHSGFVCSSTFAAEQVCLRPVRRPPLAASTHLLRCITPGTKTFRLDIGGHSEMISVDRLKPAHLDLNRSGFSCCATFSRPTTQTPTLDWI